jgi:hypothetical protein
MNTHTITTYQFSELSEEAKKIAIEKNRNFNVGYNDWQEFTIDSIKEAGELLGIEIQNFYYSGFSSQGDGAMFVGDYAYKKGAAKKIREYWPTETELHNIADSLQSIQKSVFYGLTASTRHQGHYYHENCMIVYVDHNTGREVTGYEETELTDILRDFCQWAYHLLEKEYEYLVSDEAIEESLIANECEFTENGNNY